MPAVEEATTIDAVVERLDAIIASSRSKGSRVGYFPALYRKVTIEVKDRISSGFFDDGERMERLDVMFANRYLRAHEQYGGGEGENPTEVWQFAFDVTRQWWPIVLQHHLLGMNAHINLDLGIAAVRTVGPTGLHDLHDDFNRINLVLADLVGGVQRELAEIWPTLRIMGRFLGGVDKAIVNFSMDEARDAAWSFATQLGTLDEAAQDVEIQRRDAEMLELARFVRYPGFLLGAVTNIVRLGERGDVRDILEILE